MDPHPLHIDPDVARAHTLPAEFYRDSAWFERARERVFARSWQFLGDADRLKTSGQVVPLTLLEGYLDEPVLLTRDESDRLHCLANVCTHRGNLLCEGEGHVPGLRCRYHGRRFGLDGRFASMPGFEGVEGFPCKDDDLPRVPFARWDKLLFAAVDPLMPFEEWSAEMRARIGWMPLGDLVFEPTLSRDYLVKANWALYCDNYLEGFHVPYVHPALTKALDLNAYAVELHRWSVLQIGMAARPEEAFDLPLGSPDHGKPIAAYYYWLFPNLMLNFYPWGLSVNVVTPLAPDRTRVRFLSYVRDRSKLASGAGADLDKVEREDEDIVERVQKGVSSRSYQRGRFSPRWEAGVHKFHRLLAEVMG